jgi:hypothetical protein
MPYRELEQIANMRVTFDDSGKCATNTMKAIIESDIYNLKLNKDISSIDKLDRLKTRYDVSAPTV